MLLLRYFRFKLTRFLMLVIVLTYIFITLYFTRKLKDAQRKENSSTIKASEEEVDGSRSKNVSSSSSVIAVLVLVCNRATAIRTMDQILKYRPNATKFPIVVSFDCEEEGRMVQDLMRTTYANISLTYLEHPHYDAVREVIQKDQVKPYFEAYYHLCAHYHWSLNQVFHELGHETVIIIEDDLDISPDIFEFFSATLPILRKDPTLWCVSAYNDNGKWELTNTSAVALLYRTDFFPGLGWMLQKSLWKELEPKWPKSYWDDWMRDPEQRKGRACIRPEVSRTKTYGRYGASKFVPFTKLTMEYLLKNMYDPTFKSIVRSAVNMNGIEELRRTIKRINANQELYRVSPFYIKYKNDSDFVVLAESLKLMTDFRGGIPRGSYEGVVPVMYKGYRVYLVPYDWF